MERYINEGHTDLIKFTGYTNVIGITLLLINKSGTFVWNYIDLIISCIAIVLNKYVQIFNNIVRKGNKSL